MIKSMTGYGRQTIEVGETRMHVEVRSVNHRFLDISAKIPRLLLFLEDRLKRQVKKNCSRGRVDVYVTIEGQSLFEKKVDVDWPLAEQYINKLQEMKNRYDLTGDISIDMVSKLDDIFSVQEVEEDTGELQTALLGAMQDALDQLLHMRAQEGAKLHEDLCCRVSSVSGLLQQMNKRRPVVIEEYKERIRVRIEEYTKETIHPEETKVLQEVALLAEKGDITEELTRLDSHLTQFKNTLKAEGPIGRRLDFIVQEMHREVNTIGSKSNDGEVMEAVINLKSEIEKMKEQVQNIE